MMKTESEETGKTNDFAQSAKMYSMIRTNDMLQIQM